MFSDFKQHIILEERTVLEALARLDKLAADAILFVVDGDNKLKGSLTDGDVRRGLLKGLSVDHPIKDLIHPNPKFIRKDSYSLDEIVSFREGNFKIIPIVDKENKIINVINFRLQKSYLPVDAVIMAGGRGERLKPLTDKIPKPLLKVGNKPIIEHNIDRLASYGIDDYYISLRYLGEQIESYFKSGDSKNIHIQYIYEDRPLGTIGALGKVENFGHGAVLLMNSDLLTNLNYEDFYLDFIKSGADLSILTIPYDVNIPYAVLETENGHVLSLQEKPTYTYYSNGGIYLLKKEILEMIPKDEFYNATDLIEALIKGGRKVSSYPLRGYWLDIGKHEDYNKAQRDITHLKL